MEQPRVCPLCNTGSSRKIISLPYVMWDDLYIDGYADLVSCVNCGMVYHDTAASEDDFKSYYSKNEYYAMTETEGAGGTSRNDRLRYQEIMNTLEPYMINENPTIVDIGPGRGGFLTWCKGRNLTKLIAVEQSDLCAEIIKKDEIISVYSDLKALGDNVKQIGCIVLSHILEHVFNPLDLLVTLVGLANEYTVFYVEVPNAKFYINEPNPWMYLYFEHINHFDDVHIECLLNNSGLEIEYSGMKPFVPDNNSYDECLVYVCKKKKTKETSVNNNQLSQKMITYFSSNISISDDILKYNKSTIVSIWGLSQYVQLMLGISSQLRERVAFLIDKSPAKKGRTIMGKEVYGPEKLIELEENSILLIPSNIYCNDISDFITKMKIKANVVTI